MQCGGARQNETHQNFLTLILDKIVLDDSDIEISKNVLPTRLDTNEKRHSEVCYNAQCKSKAELYRS
jgi:hypothetical protein